MALAIPDHAGCWAKELDSMFDSNIRNLDEQHSMAFLGLASPSQARARNMHNAERVVRLFAVLLNWESTLGNLKYLAILVYHIFAIVCPLLNTFLDSLQAFDCFIELKFGSEILNFSSRL